MLNPMKLHDNLWSISLAASMFNWSSVSVRQNSVRSGGGGGGGSGSGGDVDSTDRIQRSSIDSRDPLSQRFESSSLYHFPFPSNFLPRNLPEKTCSSIKEKLMNQAGGKSFMIDSLLGITNAAQVSIQNCIIPANRQCHNIDESSENKWVQEKVQYDHGKDSRYSPYHQNSRKDRGHVNVGSSSTLSTEKSREKMQKNSRRATKSKRVRTIFTPEQLERLEAEFERQQYMVGPERLYLASSLYLTEAQVKVWFQNRRIKWRKQHLEQQQQRLAVFRSKHSSLENDDVDEDYEEDTDGSTSATLPPSDSVPSSLPLLTTFTGTLLQETFNCPNKDNMLSSDSSVLSSSSNYNPSSRRPYSHTDASLYLKHQQMPAASTE